MVVNDWEKLLVDFYCPFNLAKHIAFLPSDTRNFMPLEEQTIGATWVRFLHLLKYSPKMYIPDRSYLCTFYLSLDMGDALRLDAIAGGVFANKTSEEGIEILDSLLENSSLLTSHNEPHQESESIHESLSIAEPKPFPSTSQGSSIEPFLEP
jgi:hypothetical protein